MIVAAIILLMGCGVTRANGFTVWGLTENKVGLEDNGITGRVGYQYDFIRAFSVRRGGQLTTPRAISTPRRYSHWES